MVLGKISVTGILLFVGIIIIICSIINFVENTKKITKKEDSLSINKNSFKLICPKCNIENNIINSFCTNCHYVFTKEDKDNNVSKENTGKYNEKETLEANEEIKETKQEADTKENNEKLEGKEEINKEQDKEIDKLKKEIEELKKELKKEKDIKQEQTNNEDKNK